MIFMTIFDVLKKGNIGFWGVMSKNSITKETKQNYAKAGAKSNKWLKISRIVGSAWPNGNITAITNKIYQCGCTWTSVNQIVNTLNPPNHYKNRKVITTKLFDAKMCPQTTQPVKNRLSKTEKKTNSSKNTGSDSTGSDSSNDSGSGGSDDESSTDSDTSAADNNNLTYDDILHSIASAIDAHYYIVDDVLYFNSFNVLFSGSKYKTGFPEIPVIVDYWMQEDGSLEFDVNQYGMYNTVVMEYKYGKLEVSNEDLVRVYGRVPITYKDKSLGYYDARLKAEAFLSAHIRDFGMEVKVSTLYTAKIKVGSFIKLRNPLTMSESLYYVYGMSVSYDAGENTFVADLDLRYGPENPDDPEVPEIGTAGYSNSSVSGGDFVGEYNIDSKIVEQANSIVANAKSDKAKAKAIFNWMRNNIRYTSVYYTCTKKGALGTLNDRNGNCADQTHLYMSLAGSVGLEVRCNHIDGHFFPETKINGNWFITDTTTSKGWGNHSCSGAHLAYYSDPNNFNC